MAGLVIPWMLSRADQVSVVEFRSVEPSCVSWLLPCRVPYLQYIFWQRYLAKYVCFPAQNSLAEVNSESLPDMVACSCVLELDESK